MPRLDGTGPWGLGPRTGRGLGYCRGCFGMGWSCGYCNGYGRFVSPKNELAALENQEQMLEAELAAVREEKATLTSQQK